MNLAMINPHSHFMMCHSQINMGYANKINLGCPDLRGNCENTSHVNPIDQESCISNEPLKQEDRRKMGCTISPYSSTQPDNLLESKANMDDIDMSKPDTRIDDTPLLDKLQWSMSLDEPGDAKTTIDSL